MSSKRKITRFLGEWVVVELQEAKNLFSTAVGISRTGGQCEGTQEERHIRGERVCDRISVEKYAIPRNWAGTYAKGLAVNFSA